MVPLTIVHCIWLLPPLTLIYSSTSLLHEACVQRDAPVIWWPLSLGESRFCVELFVPGYMFSSLLAIFGAALTFVCSLAYRRWKERLTEQFYAAHGPRVQRGLKRE